MDPNEWNETRSEAGLTLKRCGPGGYQATISVQGTTVSGRLWRPSEARDSLSFAPEAVPDDQVEPAVRRIRQEIDSRIDELESGHS